MRRHCIISLVPFVLFSYCTSLPGFSQDGGLGSYLSRTTAMAVRAETLKEESEGEAPVDWLEGLIVTQGKDSDSLYGYVKYDAINVASVVGFRESKQSAQKVLDIRKVSSFSFLEKDRKYIRYFRVVLESGKKPEVLEKVVDGEITYWKKAKVYHYGSRSSSTVTIPKIEYDYYFSTGNQLQKVKNFKKQLSELTSPYQIDPVKVSKDKGLKMSSPVERAMLVYHINEMIKDL